VAGYTAPAGSKILVNDKQHFCLGEAAGFLCISGSALYACLFVLTCMPSSMGILHIGYTQRYLRLRWQLQERTRAR
jgi:hypothetical protein